MIDTACDGESYTGTRVHNQLICIATSYAKIPLTGVNPARAGTYRFIAVVEIANLQLIIPSSEIRCQSCKRAFVSLVNRCSRQKNNHIVGPPAISEKS